MRTIGLRPKVQVSACQWGPYGAAMDLRGKTVVLMGRFHGLSQAEAKAGLNVLGARVTKTVSSKTDLIFRSHDVAGHQIGAASQLGIPIYDWNTLRALLKQAAEASAGVEPGADEPNSFVDHASLASAADPDSLLGVLGEADWSAFVPERDLLPLRNRLQEWERTHGVTEVHRFATERIRRSAAHGCSRLLGYDAKRRQTFAIDMTTKQMRWLTKEQRQEAGV